jgi:hypothetical protein
MLESVDPLFGAGLLVLFVVLIIWGLTKHRGRR